MKKTDVKSRRMAPLETPTDLGGQASKDIGAALNLLLADVFALYLKCDPGPVLDAPVLAEPIQ